MLTFGVDSGKLAVILKRLRITVRQTLEQSSRSLVLFGNLIIMQIHIG